MDSSEPSSPLKETNVDSIPPESRDRPVSPLSSPNKGRERGHFPRPIWRNTEGVRNILLISFPLILANLAHSLNMFIDRVLLSLYSKEAFAATLQAGIIHWAVMSVFYMTVTYSGTFIAQFTGARRSDRVGPVLWQGMYVALGSGVFLTALAFLGGPFFRWVGHEAPLPILEAQYFQILTLGGVVFLIKDNLGGFYSGRGKTGVVLIVNTFTCYANVVLDTWFIFSPPSFIPGGVQGAAIATVISGFLGAVIFAVLIFRKRFDVVFGVLKGWRPDFALLKRLLRFGFPTGVHGLVDTAAFSTFLLTVGKFGFEAQFASNAAMNINLLLFIPAIGLAQGSTIIAGQLAGGRNLKAVERLATGTVLLCAAYMAATSVLYLSIPEFLVGWFRGHISDVEWQPILRLSRMLLMIVAVYSLCDSVALSLSGILKGTGDTRFVMLLSVVFSQVLLTGPCFLLIALRDHFALRTGLYLSWAFCFCYILFLATAFGLRYRAGKWKTIDVIETTPDPPNVEGPKEPNPYDRNATSQAS